MYVKVVACTWSLCPIPGTNRPVPLLRLRTRPTSPKVPLSPSHTLPLSSNNNPIRQNPRSRTNSPACLASSRNSAMRWHRNWVPRSTPRPMPSMAHQSRRRRTASGALHPRVRVTRSSGTWTVVPTSMRCPRHWRVPRSISGFWTVGIPGTTVLEGMRLTRHFRVAFSGTLPETSPGEARTVPAGSDAVGCSAARSPGEHHCVQGGDPGTDPYVPYVLCVNRQTDSTRSLLPSHQASSGRPPRKHCRFPSPRSSSRPPGTRGVHPHFSPELVSRCRKPGQDV